MTLAKAHFALCDEHAPSARTDVCVMTVATVDAIRDVDDDNHR